MSLQVCPKCGVRQITWWIDDEESPRTQWLCSECGYKAEEDESMSKDCSRCHDQKSSLLVRDEQGYHRWCKACGFFAETDDTFPDDGT